MAGFRACPRLKRTNKVGIGRIGCRADAVRAAGDQRDASLEVVVVGHEAFLYGHGVRYPLGTERRDQVRTPGGLSLDELDLHGEQVSREELRATPETLRLQAEVAEEAGRRELGANLRRAAELAAVPEELVLDVYTALRPRRSSAEQLESWAVRLEEVGAPLNAAFVREARDVYAARLLLA